MSLPEFDRKDRPSALTTPAVTEHWNPYGLPMAMATWPTRISLRVSQSSRHEICGVDPNHGKVRVRVIAYHLCVQLTSIKQRDAQVWLAPWTTWLLVRINPSGVNTNPEPLPIRCWYRSTACLDDRSLLQHVDMNDGSVHSIGGVDNCLRVSIQQQYVVNR